MRDIIQFKVFTVDLFNGFTVFFTLIIATSFQKASINQFKGY